MTNLDQPSKLGYPSLDQLDTRTLAASTSANSSNELDNHIQRIRRIGKRLFGVANCVVRFVGGATSNSPAQGKRSMETIELAFCESVPFSEHASSVPDTRNDLVLADHRYVVGAPYIRFYASYPIFNGGTLIGSINLVDYTARNFSEEDKQALGDLAVLVERELRVTALNAAQLELQRKNRNLRRESLVDPVIGTWNRNAITRALGVEVERCQKEQLPLSVVFVDLDSIKQITDTYGHQVGDSLLLKASSRLRSCIRPTDALGRFEAEKFLVVLPGASHEIAKVVAERIRQAIMSQPEPVGSDAVSLTMSAGTVSTDRYPNAGIDQLISCADVALRSAKNAGVNRIVQSLPTLHDRA